MPVRPRRSSSAKKSTARPSQVFISYAREDVDSARTFAEELRAAGFEPWMDEQQLHPGENWSQAIGSAIEKSDLIVLLVSKAFLRSPRLLQDWNFAISSKRHAGRVLPVLAPGTPLDSVPWILKHLPHLSASHDWRRAGKRAAARLHHLDEAD